MIIPHDLPNDRKNINILYCLDTSCQNEIWLPYFWWAWWASFPFKIYQLDAWYANSRQTYCCHFYHVCHFEENNLQQRTKSIFFVMFLSKTWEKQNLRMIALLLIGWLCPALSLPEIWPPDGRLRPNNYVPPPVCSYVQVTLMIVTVMVI